jgi:hypothetical protein
MNGYTRIKVESGKLIPNYIDDFGPHVAVQCAAAAVKALVAVYYLWLVLCRQEAL